MDPLDIMKMNYKDRSLAAMEWKAKGKKVAGYIGDDVPEEMILAAGFFPFRMSGDPGSGTKEADKFAEEFYDPSVRSILNMLLTGQYHFLDYIIFSHANDAALKLYHQLWWIHNLDPAISFPPVHLFDILHTKYLTTGLYVRDQVSKLKTKLEEWSANGISREKLSQSISIVNKNRALLQKIKELRAEPSRISGVEALQIIGSSMFMLKEDHNKLLEKFIDSVNTLPAKNEIRLFIEGSDIDNTEFYEIVESSGAIIAGENSSWGNSYPEDPVDESADPLEAIAERYHLRPSRYRTQSIEERTAYCMHGTVKAKAQGVIFYLTEGDPAPTWDVPNQKKELEKNNIKTLTLSNQKYFTPDTSGKTAIKTSIQKFIESIKKR